MKFGIAGVIVCLALIGVVRSKSGTHVTSAGFWFDDVSYSPDEVQAPRLGSAITKEELRRIQVVARSELEAAYSGLRVTFSERRDAKYTVRVVQSTKGHSLSAVRWGFESAGQSRAVPRFGGTGIVNFRLLANLAIVLAPPDASRSTIVDGIGRGVGRAAAHEFAHVFLPTAPIHDTQDRRSYEYRSADRAAQFYGEMHWDLAGPMLSKRLGTTASSSR